MTISLFRDFQCTANPSNATYKTDSPDSFGHRGKQRQAIRAERLEKRLTDQEISSRLSNQIRDLFLHLCISLPSSLFKSITHFGIKLRDVVLYTNPPWSNN